MKKLLLFVLFFSALNSFACDCDFNIINLYQKADFERAIHEGRGERDDLERFGYFRCGSELGDKA